MKLRQVAVLGVLVVLACGVAIAAAADLAAQEKALQELLVAKLGGDAGTIRVTLVKNKAILTGAVKQRAVQELSTEVALSVAGVTKVDNQVTSEGEGKIFSGKVKQEAADADLESTVNKAVKAEIGSHIKAIEVEACNGWVSLRGTSPDAARRDLALSSAAKVEGVKKVIDLLVVEAK
jgi:osmotically-inducible protein OsmY